ncbi:MAG: hypothetical protein AABX48_01915 [Nanoarchaeota archaeon]
MNCCQVKDDCSLCNNNLKEKKNISWKTIIVVIIILGLLMISSFGALYH